MSYATIEDVEIRSRRVLTIDEKSACEALLDDVAALIDSYNENARDDAKKIVSCNAVLRALGDGSCSVPMGASQGTVSALGYSQTWMMSNGSTGELYLNKAEKRLLGIGNRAGFSNPYGEAES